MCTRLASSPAPRRRRLLPCLVVLGVLGAGTLPARADALDALRQARRVYNAVNTALMKSPSTTQLYYRHYVYGEAISKELLEGAGRKIQCTRRWGSANVDELREGLARKVEAQARLQQNANQAFANWLGGNPQSNAQLWQAWQSAIDQVARAGQEVDAWQDAVDNAMSSAPYNSMFSAVTNGGANCGEHARMVLVGLDLLRTLDAKRDIVGLFEAVVGPGPSASGAWGDWAASGDHVFAIAVTSDGSIIMVDTWAGGVLFMHQALRGTYSWNDEAALASRLNASGQILFQRYVQDLLMLDQNAIPPNPYVSAASTLTIRVYDRAELLAKGQSARLYDAGFNLLTEAERGTLGL